MNREERLLHLQKLRKLRRIHRMKRLLDRVAYISLFFDVAIALITLLSLRVFAYDPASILVYVNYGLTIVVIIGAFLFLIMSFLSYYDKLMAVVQFRLPKKPE